MPDAANWRILPPERAILGLLDEAFQPWNGHPLLVVEATNLPLRPPSGAIVVAVDRAGDLPEVDTDCCDALITTRPNASMPWVSVPASRLEARLDALWSNVSRAPIAAALLVQVLRIGERLSFSDALTVESLAYSTLLGGAEFSRWLTQRVCGDAAGAAHVRYERVGDTVTLTLAAPMTRNAMTSAMRDALYEALVNTLEDPTRPHVVLRGEGRCFSTGGQMSEFGSTDDLALAHAVRSRRSAAALLHALGDRAEVRLHGACIGSGIELAAAAHRRVAASNAFFQLPELAMGLIPGAGGLVTLPRAIGRHRTAWMALSGLRLSARTALAWGLLHAIQP